MRKPRTAYILHGSAGAFRGSAQDTTNAKIKDGGKMTVEEMTAELGDARERLAQLKERL